MEVWFLYEEWGPEFLERAHSLASLLDSKNIKYHFSEEDDGDVEFPPVVIDIIPRKQDKLLPHEKTKENE